MYAVCTIARATIADTMVRTARHRVAEFSELSTATFDTLKFSETMRESGMPEAQAKALSQALRADIQQIEPRLTIRLGGIVVVALGAFTALSRWMG